jgi:CheY-like chemotaxis protein
MDIPYPMGSQATVEGLRLVRKPRVLVVDDEISIAKTLQAILSHEGFEVAIAFRGEEAVSVARDWRPDLVLSDVVMPGISGIEAAIQIREMLPACRIVLISGQGMVYDMMETARARGYDFDLLMKPMHPLDLIEYLRRVLGLH